MPVTQNPTANQPKRVRVHTLRPWINVTPNGETGELDRRIVEIGEVVEVDRLLGAELVSCQKAELVDAKTPVGKTPAAKKAA